MIGGLLGELEPLGIGLFGTHRRHDTAQRTLQDLLGGSVHGIVALAQESLHSALQPLLLATGELDVGSPLDGDWDHAGAEGLR